MRKTMIELFEINITIEFTKFLDKDIKIQLKIF